MQTGGARLVTPEAVVLQFETASLGSRVPAILLDLAVQLTLLLALGLALTAIGGTTGNVLLYLLITFVLFGYPVLFETLWRGRSPGKAALGLRVVRKDGAPVRFRHSLVRSFLGLVDFWLTTGAAAVIAVLLTRNNQRLGDLAAGTLVLRERSGAGRSAPVRFEVPYGWEGYAATLDTSGLTPGGVRGGPVVPPAGGQPAPAGAERTGRAGGDDRGRPDAPPPAARGRPRAVPRLRGRGPPAPLGPAGPGAVGAGRTGPASAPAEVWAVATRPSAPGGGEAPPPHPGPPPAGGFTPPS